MIGWFATLVLTAAAPQPAPASVPVTVSVQRERDGTQTLVHLTEIDAPIARIWDAISTPEGWRGWAAPVARTVDGEPDMLETSYSVDALPGDATTIRQLFTARIPGRMLAFRTVKAPTGFPNFDTYRAVVTIFELEPLTDKRTRVRLTATGYADSDAGRQLLGFFRAGNRETLDKLRTYLSATP